MPLNNETLYTPLGGGAPEFSQDKAAEGSDLRPPHTSVSEPRRLPAGSPPGNALDPTPQGCEGDAGETLISHLSASSPEENSGIAVSRLAV